MLRREVKLLDRLLMPAGVEWSAKEIEKRQRALVRDLHEEFPEIFEVRSGTSEFRWSAQAAGTFLSIWVIDNQCMDLAFGSRTYCADTFAAEIQRLQLHIRNVTLRAAHALGATVDAELLRQDDGAHSIIQVHRRKARSRRLREINDLFVSETNPRLEPIFPHAGVAQVTGLVSAIFPNGWFELSDVRLLRDIPVDMHDVRFQKRILVLHRNYHSATKQRSQILAALDDKARVTPTVAIAWDSVSGKPSYLILKDLEGQMPR